MSTRHHASVRGQRDVDFACASCGFAARLRVQAEGSATATSYIVLDRDRARTRAADAAAEDATEHARDTAAILPCPKCGVRRRGAVVWFAAVGAFGTLGLIALGGLLLVLVGGLGGTAFAAVFAALGGSVAWSRWKHYTRAAALVDGMQITPTLPAATAVIAPRFAAQPTREPEKIEAAPIEGGPRTLR